MTITIADVRAAEVALLHAQDTYADAKKALALAECPYQQGQKVETVFRNRDAWLFVDMVLVRLRKDGFYEWAAVGYIQFQDSKTRTNYRTELTGIIQG